MPERVRSIIADIMTAASNCSLYSENHPSVDRFTKRAIRELSSLYTDGAASFTILGGNLMFNDFIKVSKKSIHVTTFMEKLRRKGIEKVIIRDGVTPEEFRRFVADLAPPTRTPRSSPHISLGIVDVKMGTDAGMDVTSVIQRDTARAEQIHKGLSRFGKLDMVGLEEIVVNFIAALKREANVLKIISPVKAYSQYTFAHITNVTILSIFQAEALGLSGGVLHEVGLAGLLHDVGKMFIPKEILEKQGRLTAEEWAVMQKHTVYGAMYLSTLMNVPKLAVIAAYEHHMRFDGSGYPEPRRRGKRQHLVSQIVAIADTFDAMRTERSYQKGLPLPAAVAILRKGAGKTLNPELVDNFLRSLKAADILEAEA